MSILVTGGAGYIGSHTSVELLNSGYHIVVVDNLSNSNRASLDRVKEITGKEFPFHQIDITNKDDLEIVFKKYNIDAVLHFAGLKAVGESVKTPLVYYNNNLMGSIALFELMAEYNVKKLVFSSSATVYGIPSQVPIDENESTGAINPYGRTKLMIEEILRDLYISDNNWSISILRYFNPIGAHSSGLIGENPKGIPNNLFPHIINTALNKNEKVFVFGNDYPTNDGTGVRDYIHVVDLAIAHIKALEMVMVSTGVETYNIGTGKGYSVLELITTFEKVTGVKIPYQFVQRRQGDTAVSYSNPNKAKDKLGWVAKKNLQDMCKDGWNWQSNNPRGYE